MRTDCDDETCKEKLLKLIQQFPDLNDETFDLDYCWYHCRHVGCHEIALGTTSTNCSKCGEWMCSTHLTNIEEISQEDINESFCEACLQIWKNMKVNKLKC
jgi:hypothetical protein